MTGEAQYLIPESLLVKLFRKTGSLAHGISETQERIDLRIELLDRKSNGCDQCALDEYRAGHIDGIKQGRYEVIESIRDKITTHIDDLYLIKDPKDVENAEYEQRVLKRVLSILDEER